MLLGNANGVVELCVKTQGIGGWHETVRSQYMPIYAPLMSTQNVVAMVKRLRWLHTFIILSPSSEECSEYKWHCATEAEGNAVCENAGDESEPPTKNPITGGGDWDAEGRGDAGRGASADPQPPARQQCNERCTEPDDYDYANGCICLHAKLHSRFPSLLPLKQWNRVRRPVRESCYDSTIAECECLLR